MPARATSRPDPVAIVNDGPTRGDDVAALKLESPLGETLARVVDQIRNGAGHASSFGTRTRAMTLPGHG